MRALHLERHKVGSVGWLRAAVLGANDGLLSTASLVIGVASATPEHGAILIAGIAGLLAGSLSMAAGEYVSVSSQRDAEQADLARETQELATQPEAEHRELVGIYVARGLTPDLAEQVVDQLMAKDALGAHLRDELGLSEATAARPLQAALASALAFAVGALPPLLIALLVAPAAIVVSIAASSLVVLAILGALGARAGGAKIWAAVLRVTFWGALAMLVTAGVGRLFGTTV
ncbi:MAG: VIT family protein [Proteobacteria bacterium]|nr:VIT family protein [Pseudomonadota bacterium]